jgi:NADH-quinone oxidoreductase subunit M
MSLAGLIALYVQSGAASFNLIELRAAMAGESLSTVAQNYTFALLLFGFGILVSLWPFHTWAPLGYGAAPTSAAMLHAGVLKKFGLYGLVQIGAPLLPEGAANWAVLLAWLALGNVILIGFVTIAQRDLKQMIGFSSVMHMGYCFLGLACLTTMGVGGAVLLMFAHGLSVALLFLLGSCIFHRTRTFDMGSIGGLAQRAPLLAAFYAVAILASIGLPGPGLANFWGELTVFIALWDFRAWMVVPAVFGVVISAVYGLRSLANIFFGEPTEAFAKSVDLSAIKDLHWREKAPAFLLLSILIFVGVWPKSVSDPLDRSLSQIYSTETRQVEETPRTASVEP